MYCGYILALLRKILHTPNLTRRLQIQSFFHAGSDYVRSEAYVFIVDTIIKRIGQCHFGASYVMLQI